MVTVSIREYAVMTTNQTQLDQLADLSTETQLAQFLNTEVRTLQSWRYQKIGIPFIKIGRSVRYRKSDVEAYLANQRVEVQQ